MPRDVPPFLFVMACIFVPQIIAFAVIAYKEGAPLWSRKFWRR